MGVNYKLSHGAGHPVEFTGTCTGSCAAPHVHKRSGERVSSVARKLMTVQNSSGQEGEEQFKEICKKTLYLVWKLINVADKIECR